MSRSLLGSFSRAQVSSATASAVDFGLLFSLTELLGVWYVAATAIGALAGAVVNFLMNRHWSFLAHRELVHVQIVRYTITSGLSLVLNTAGVWAVTELLHVHYAISVAVVTFVVGIAFNFPMHRYFVFRIPPSQHQPQELPQ